MFVSRLVKHAAVAVAGLVLAAGVGSVTAQARPVQATASTLAHSISEPGVETIQYRDRRDERDWRRHERRRYFDERRDFRRMDQHRRYREWRRNSY